MEGSAAEGLLAAPLDPALAGLSPEAREELEALACILEPEELALAGPCARCREKGLICTQDGQQRGHERREALLQAVQQGQEDLRAL